MLEGGGSLVGLHVSHRNTVPVSWVEVEPNPEDVGYVGRVGSGWEKRTIDGETLKGDGDPRRKSVPTPVVHPSRVASVRTEGVPERI